MLGTRSGTEAQVRNDNGTPAVSPDVNSLIDLVQMAALGRLMRGMVHEINNSLGFLISNNNYLKSYVEPIRRLMARYEGLTKVLTPEQRRGQAAILGEIRDLKNNFDIEYFLKEVDGVLADNSTGLLKTRMIIDDLKTFRQSDDMETTSVDLRDLIKKVLSVLGPELKGRIYVETIFGDLPPIGCIQSELCRAILIILTNIIDEINEKGRIFIQTRSENDRAIIEFTYDGPGVEPARSADSDKPSYSARDSADADNFGMLVADRIASKYGGTTETVDIPEKGRRITMTVAMDA